MKLSRKVYLYSSVLFIMLFCIASVVIYIVFSRISLQYEFNQLEAETRKASIDIQQISDNATLAELLRAYVPVQGLVAIVNDTNTNPIVVTSPTELALAQYDFVYSPSFVKKRINLGEQSYSFVSLPFINANGQVMNIQMMVNLAELLSLLHLLRLILIIVAVCVIIPALVSSRVLSKFIMQPIKAMTKTMRHVLQSNRFVRLQQVGQSKDELYEMGETFNQMIDLLETNYKRQEQFVSNASHELKTPITVIESYASLIKRRGKQQPELVEESIEAIHSESLRMKAMTEQLLLLAKPVRQWKIELVETNLVPIVKKTAAHIKKAYGRDIIVSLSKFGGDKTVIELEGSQNRLANNDAEVVVKTDAKMVSQLYIIFLDNARKYSEAPIEVNIEQQKKVSLIRVIDRGVGISKSALPRVFERFYREDEARTRDDYDDRASVGLGLSLAKEIADVIEVKVEIDSVEGLGTTATIYFPN